MPATITASLLKRLGEAADGYRTGADIWCAAEIAFPHELEVFPTEQEAKQYCSQQGTQYEVFGPYCTPVDARKAVSGRVLNIKVTVESGGTTKDIDIDPNEVDALFWGESSADKFVFPYYTSLYGVEKAAQMKRDFLTSQAVIFGHTDGTRWLPRT